MPEYIAKFLAVGIRLLLKGKGQEFLNEYYSYVEKIYNYQIPLRDIATKGKIKKSLKEYMADVRTLTKAGRPKSRQAWYELAIKEGLNVDNGDTIYYVNTGKAKSHADVKKVRHYYTYDESNDKIDVTKAVEKEYKVWKKENAGYEITSFLKNVHPDYFSEDEIVLNCMLVPRDIVDKEEDTFCSDVSEDLEYNVEKYVDMFNKRITPLLVCFSRDIRGQILVSNPEDRKYFTEEECELVSGQPNKPSDQDTYEQLMTMEDKEIKFWTKYGLVPPFIEECGMGKWEDIVADYERRMEEERVNGVAAEKEAFASILADMTDEDFEKFSNDGTLPAAMLKIVDLDPESTSLVSKKYAGVVIGDINDILSYSLEKETDDE